MVLLMVAWSAAALECAAEGTWTTNRVRNTFLPGSRGESFSTTAETPFKPRAGVVFKIVSPHEGVLGNVRLTLSSLGTGSPPGTVTPDGTVVDPYGADFTRVQATFARMDKDPREGGTTLPGSERAVPWGRYSIAPEKGIFDPFLNQALDVSYPGIIGGSPEQGIRLDAGTNWIQFQNVRLQPGAGFILAMRTPLQNPSLNDVATSNGSFLSAGTLSISADVIALEQPPILRFLLTDSSLVLSWDASGYHLESAADLTGAPWIPFPGSSPQPVPPTGRHAFFRLAK